MAATRYIILTLEDAKRLSDAAAPADGASPDPRLAQIHSRIQAETGADIEDIVAQLKALPTCVACHHESMEHSCESLEARKLGRRLRRLVDRALN